MFDQKIQDIKSRLYHHGSVIESEEWQSKKMDIQMRELIGVTLKSAFSKDLDMLRSDIRPNLPWADVHFEERVSGIPHNPPPSHKIWPFAQNQNKEFTPEGAFSHTYPERMWGYKGNLGSVVELLKKNRETRQAYLPIWFEKDTGNIDGVRVPCTLGYHFLIRNNFLYLFYDIRSCDIIRHFRDDIYLAIRLGLWVIEQVDPCIEPAMFVMNIHSLHCFEREKSILLNKKF